MSTLNTGTSSPGTPLDVAGLREFRSATGIALSVWTQNDGIFFTGANPSGTDTIIIADADAQGNTGWRDSLLGLPPAKWLLSVVGPSGASVFQVNAFTDEGGGYTGLSVVFKSGCNVAWSAIDYAASLSYLTDLRADLGPINGEITLNPKLGVYQSCWINDDLAFNISDTGAQEGDMFSLGVQYSTGGNAIDLLSEVKHPSWEGVSFPITPTAWASVLLEFHYIGGYWIIKNVVGETAERLD